MEIFLFDLDGVLLNSAGYHRSLIETVRLLSLTLGFGDRGLTQEEIDAFEARDITAEWDSSALCAALLLVTAWEADDDVSLPTRPPLGLPRPARHAFPDIRRFLAELDRRRPNDPLAEAEASLLRRIDSRRPDHAASVRSLLAGARSLDDSLTFRLVQMYNLGSRRFEEIYGEAAGMESPSCLETYDLPTLNALERASLLRKLDQAGRSAAIVTNRPSSSPLRLRSRRPGAPKRVHRPGVLPGGQAGGVFDTPEAEIGVRAAGFDRLPRVAAGDLGWQATALGLDVQSFLKPSPVHMLAGLLRAIGNDGVQAVEMAIRLAHGGGGMEPAWRAVDGARLVLFEDAPKGHTSARRAVEILRSNDVSVDLAAYGIATNPDKVAALTAVGARIFPHVGQALEDALPGWRA
jgi:phosphoglycolate phosphatase-like HAD superfamily hydrolase